jgi:hypothetical protein
MLKFALGRGAQSQQTSCWNTAITVKAFGKPDAVGCLPQYRKA